MKKKLAVLALVAFFATIISSCKSHERCPAYGKVETVSDISSKV